MSFKKQVLIIVLVIVVGALFLRSASEGRPTGGNGVGANSCLVQTAKSVKVGHQEALTILSSKANRAWARIQMANNATNTLAVATSTSATFTTGLYLGEIGATTTTNFFDVGLDTDFPYTGVITGITSRSTTSVNIIDCLYQ